MTDLLGEDAPDPVVLVLHWLQPLGEPHQFGMVRKENDPLPYWQVGLIAGSDNPTAGTAEATVSVHFMTQSVGGVDADTLAVRGGRVTHRRMTELARHPDHNITIGDRVANVDWVETVELPSWRDYDDTQISRVKAVYRLGLSYVAL